MLSTFSRICRPFVCVLQKNVCLGPSPIIWSAFSGCVLPRSRVNCVCVRDVSRVRRAGRGHLCPASSAARPFAAQPCGVLCRLSCSLPLLLASNPKSYRQDQRPGAHSPCLQGLLRSRVSLENLESIPSRRLCMARGGLPVAAFGMCCFSPLCILGSSLKN